MTKAKHQANQDRRRRLRRMRDVSEWLVPTVMAVAIAWTLLVAYAYFEPWYILANLGWVDPFLKAHFVVLVVIEGLVCCASAGTIFAYRSAVAALGPEEQARLDTQYRKREAARRREWEEENARQVRAALARGNKAESERRARARNPR